MCKIAGGEGEVYRRKQLKRKLKDCYGDHVFLAEMYGRNDVVCFRNMANYILNERCYSDWKSDSTQDAYTIIQSTAQIIREEVCETTFTKADYPSTGDIMDIEKGKEYMPPSLKTWLANLIPTNEIRQ